MVSRIQGYTITLHSIAAAPTHLGLQEQTMYVSKERRNLAPSD